MSENLSCSLRQRSVVVVTAEDQELFAAINLAVGIIREEVKAYAELHPDDHPELHIYDGEYFINPHHHQTAHGLYLEMASLPTRIWTPWGICEFASGGSGKLTDEIKDAIIRRLGAVRYPKLDRGIGEYCPVYALHRIDAQRLPEPRLRKPDELVPVKTAELAWELLHGIADEAY